MEEWGEENVNLLCIRNICSNNINISTADNSADLNNGNTRFKKKVNPHVNTC